MKYLINGFRGFCMALADSVPGVSGGTIAFVLGFYDKFITSLNDIVFGFGVITGIILVIKLIKTALEKYRSQTVYLIIGLMIGSLYAIVMGPTTLETAQNAMSLSTSSIIYFVLGGAIILGLEKAKKVLEQKNMNE